MEAGDDLTVVALGTRLDAVLRASEHVRTEFSCDVLYVNAIRPLDTSSIVESVRRTGALVVVEEHSVIGGLGDTLLQSLAGLAFSYEKLGIREFIHAYGTYDDLCNIARIGDEAIVTALREAVST